MDSAVSRSTFISLILLLLLSVSSAASAQAEQGQSSCNACNCQINNIELLTQLIKSEVAAFQTNESTAVSGVTYIRWGHTTCPSSTGAQLVYSGRAGGTNWNHRGGAAEKLCLPDDPDYIPATANATVTHINTVQGAEYEFFTGPLANVTQYNAPCAVCFVSTRATVIMVPAKTICPSSWTREYYGYLTANFDGHHRSSYTCLDISPGTVPGSGADTFGAYFYYTITDCNGLSCPPYENNRILSCAVCTK